MGVFFLNPTEMLRRILSASLVSLIGSSVISLEVFSTAAFAQLSDASVETKLKVPNSMNYAPFNINRYLKVPPNFSISVYARIQNARFMAVAPNGDLLVSQPGKGKVLIVKSNGTKDPIISDFVTGLRKPHDIVFHKIGDITYVYISETHQINRFIYNSGDITAQNREIVVTGLPDSSTSELRGAYGHELKNIALDSNHKLYVSIASTCNACKEDTVSDPVRGAIYQYNADGSGKRLFAQGLRNAEGLAFVPGTNDLWVVVNNRDNIAYPFNDGSGNYGKIISSYVDNHPPEEFTKVRDGGNYGWPFCNPNPDTSNGLNNMPFDQDYEFNSDGSVDCNAMDRINKGIQAHSAPLGLTFLQNTNFPSLYSTGAVAGLHGSWNRQNKTGYRIAYFPWNTTTNTPGDEMDLVSGWLVPGTQEIWGRPVDMVVDQEGNLLISDDYSGTIYKLSYNVSNIPSQEVKVYTDPNFAGVSQSFPATPGVYKANQGDLNIVGNDAISSLSVPSGIVVRVCQHETGGICRDYTAGNYSSMASGLNNSISFIEVKLPDAASQQVKVYSDPNFAGISQSFPTTPGVYKANQGDLNIVGNDAISSLSVPSGTVVRVCQHETGGRCREYSAGDYNYVGSDLDNMISFIEVK
ncbi:MULTISPECIES: PQQ-dependent sugar dehydrogenase [unclassified Nostoc]|uniref:PQQ-dependent sugar dehydrogenase n=1 Tax=unclassified Nostoc TaxID=2593658 RepID=UPI002AD1D6DF|nr:PQQ-dependent sugar dehydrogenase [Nostoc sp. DedQUE03]MDZ7976871.1 PQQ-dependent sugar dehydrogenase [Nostoc sp. DedQUE03]MDZ8043382.1 PQQ-dependent sugar dehydrogenase [Nostoc sp. DedQUE02]